MLCSKWKGSTIFHLLYHPCRMYIHRIQISASSSCSYQSSTLHWISMPLSCCGVRDGNALNKFLREERSPPLFIPLSVLCEMLSYLSWTVSEHIRFLFFFLQENAPSTLGDWRRWISPWLSRLKKSTLPFNDVYIWLLGRSNEVLILIVVVTTAVLNSSCSVCAGRYLRLWKSFFNYTLACRTLLA